MSRSSKLGLRRLFLCFVFGTIPACDSVKPPDPVPTAPPPLQALHIMAGVGSFAYFQLLWPQVEIALADNPSFATLEPSSEGVLIPGDASGNKEWFATSMAPWIDANGVPFPGMEITAFLSGGNRTHTYTAGAILTLASGFGFYASPLTYRRMPAAPFPIVAVPRGIEFGAAPGALLPSVAMSNDLLIALYAADGPDLTPTPEELALFDIANAPAPGLADFGRSLIIATKALTSNLSNVIVVSMPGLDPHGAFADIPYTTSVVTYLQTVLNGVYELLRTPWAGTPSHVDRVLITVQGDTPKNPLVRAGWPDSTPGGSNWIYVVGKGYLKHGWFGRIHATGTVSGYDPATGMDDPDRSSSSTEGQTAAAIVYATTRGDAAFVENALIGGARSTYGGVVRP